MVKAFARLPLPLPHRQDGALVRNWFGELGRLLTLIVSLDSDVAENSKKIPSSHYQVSDLLGHGRVRSFFFVAP